MQPSPAPPESPDKAVDSEVSLGSLSRFETLAAKLFAVDPTRFRDTLAKDEKERRAKRGR